MQLAVYAHPFDLAALADHGGLDRLKGLGISEIAMAVSYHDGRWLQPWNDATRVRFLEDGTVHYRPDSERDYGRLQPLPSSFVPAQNDEPSPLARLGLDAGRAGLAARAWTVFTHNTRLGELHPDLAIENAFGDRHVYGLCPARPAVQDYITGMVGDLASHDGLSTIELEALGWMGWKHGSHHDKASFQPRGRLGYALSVCFCDSCMAAMTTAGGDPVAIRAFARNLIAEHIERADAMAPTEASDDDDVFGPVRAARVATLEALGARVREAAAERSQLAVQVHRDPLFTGSQLSASQAGGLPAAERVVTAYGEDPAAIAAHLSDPATWATGGADAPRRLSFWPKAPQFTSDEDLVKVRELCREHGVESIAIYHLGLLPWRTLERAARVLQA